MSNFAPNLLSNLINNTLLPLNGGQNSNQYQNGVDTFNPTSKQQNIQNGSSFSIGLQTGSFGFGLATGGTDPQRGERIDYNAFLQQAGTILRNSRFMCTVFFPTTMGQIGASANRSASYACEHVSIPQQTIETTEYRMNMMPTIMAPHMRNYGGTVDLRFRMYTKDAGIAKSDSFSFGIKTGNFSFGLSSQSGGISGSLTNMEPRASLLRWQEQIVTFNSEFSGANYYEEYTKNSSIIVTSLDTSSRVLHNVEFLDAYPVVVGGIEYDWADNTTYMTQNVTFAFSKIIDSYYGLPQFGPETNQGSGLGVINGLVNAISNKDPDISQVFGNNLMATAPGIRQT